MPADRAHLVWFVGDSPGARARFQAVAPHLAAVRTTLVTVGPAGSAPAGVDRRIELPWDELPTSAAGRALYDPPGLPAWWVQDRPDLLVVDGDQAQQLAAVARATGTTAVTVGHPGDARVISLLPADTSAHLLPYPAVLEPGSRPSALDRDVHVGWLSRFAGRRPNRTAGRRALGLSPDLRVVTVICGRDGLGTHADLAGAAHATPGWTWVTVGRVGLADAVVPANLIRLGWRDEPWAALEAADVVVSGGGTSVVAEVASARRPSIVVPRPGRPDDLAHGRALAAVGAARVVHGWPETDAWERLLATAVSDGAEPARIDDGRGPARAGQWLTALAQVGHPQVRARGLVPTTPR